MKKLLLAAALVAASATMALAQSITPIIEVGGGAANFSTKTSVGETTSGMIGSYRVGGGVEVGFAGDFFVSPELLFVSRGAAEKSSVGSASTMTHNIEIPIFVGYRAAFAPNMGVSVEAGPYLAYMIAATGKANVLGVEASSDKQPVKPFDFGVGVQANFEYNRFGIGIGTEYGILNVSKTDGVRTNNMNFYGVLSYRF